MAEETIVAVYDSAEHADMAVRDLEAAGVPSTAIHRHAGQSMRTGSTTTDQPREQGFWASLFGGNSDYTRDADIYDRSLSGGSTVVTVQASDQHLARAMEILERHNPIDLDERASGYGLGSGAGDMQTGATGAGMAPGGSGMSGVEPSSAATARSADLGAEGSGMNAAGSGGAVNTAPRTEDTALGSAGSVAAGPDGTGEAGLGGTRAAGAGMSGATARETGLAADRAGERGTMTGDTARAGEETVPLAEESLEVGKRAVNRGSTRVRRYVIETPVEETVTLRDETASVERRPVAEGRPVTDADFSDKVVEVTESTEEPVVSKKARVREEVVIHKGATERTETVRDTVRREDVEVTKGSDTERGTVAGTETGRTTGKPRV